MDGERESYVSRRSILRRAPAFAALPLVTLASHADANGSAELHDLWNKRRNLRTPAIEAFAAYCAACDAMPWWAQGGPKYLLHDGTHAGPMSWMPAIVDLAPPTIEGAQRFIRPSREDIERQYSMHPFSGARKTEESRQKALDAFDERLRAQRAEQVRFNVDAIGECSDALCGQISDLSSAVLAASHFSADAVAAQMMVHIAFAAVSDESTKQGIAGYHETLQLLRPHLTGNIAADVADLLDNLDAPISEHMVWL